MTIHNFMLEDIAGCLKAICLLPLFVLVPGYAVAWVCGIFEFRQRTAAFRLALSMPLSIGICPAITYLLGRFCGMPAVWTFYGAAGIVFVVAITRPPRRFSGSREIGIAAGVLTIWLIVSLASLIDIQLGDRLYYPTSSLDNSIRTAFVHSISSMGIPPKSPLFLPGQAVPLRYHYFWLMMCSLAETAGRGAVTARQALIAGTFWCGAGLLALVALYLRLFAAGDPRRFRRRTLAAFVLLGITGLDIIPTVFLLLLHARGALPFVLPSVEWWNEHVDWFVYSTLWAPHALASLLACLTAFLLLWWAPSAAGRSGRMVYSALAGVALASSIGASIYVSFVFAVFLMAWTAVTLWKKWYRETATLMVAGTTCVLLALPYLLSLRGAGAGPAAGPPLQFTVRAFSLAALVPGWRGMSAAWRLILVNLPLIPLNYLLEFGFFFAVGALQWRRYRSGGAAWTRQQLACLTMVASSILICTFVRSSIIGCNDLGWRGLLVAQFILVLWAADFLDAGLRLPFIGAAERRLLAVFLALGAAGTVYDLALTRIYPILADNRVVPPLDWMSPDRQMGKRTYATRAAYEWAQAATSGTATLQYNPHVTFQETTAMLYSDRRTVASDMSCHTTFGGDDNLCPPVITELQRLYPPAGREADSGIRNVCASLPIDLVVAKDTDGAWSDRRSWVWRERPLLENDYIRMFACNSPRIFLSQRSITH